MNKKQLFVLFLGIIALIAIAVLTPRYKLTKIDSKNYIKTEQSSSLYPRCSGVTKLHWDKIFVYWGATLFVSGALLFALKGKNG